jgi:uncharacterized protein YydD (DUF2326 family)
VQKKRQQLKSQKQLNEFEGKEKHIWKGKLNKLVELRFREIEEEDQVISDEKDSGA